MTNKYNSITVLQKKHNSNKNDFISLTDMLKAKNADFFISDWLRNRNTLEYLGIWEKIHNPDFNYGEFATIKSQSGLNSYKVNVKAWVTKTKAIGLTTKFGKTLKWKKKLLAQRHSGTAKIKSICSQINADVRRLNKQNLRRGNLLWLPFSLFFAYVNQSDILNMALFGKTAKWINKFSHSVTMTQRKIKNQMKILLDNHSINKLEKSTKK